MTEVINIPISQIITGLNNRTVFTDLDSLAESMRDIGLAQPITVRPAPGQPGTWQLVAGERRTRAAMLLGWETIPAIVREMDDEAATAVMLAENTHRADIDPMDEATGYNAAMHIYGWDAAACARRANVTLDRVQRRLALLTLLPDIQHLVRNGNLPRGHAEAMTGLDANRQIIALRVFSDSERKPTIAEFQQVCADLVAEQNQQCMFDLEQFWVAQLVEGTGKRARKTRLPRDPRIPPPLRWTRRDWLANQMKDYADQLLAAGLSEGAHTLYAVIDHCLDRGLLQAAEERF